MRGRVLIVAGSDSGGGAGIQADIKTVTMLDGYAATAITALTAQNTEGVFGVLPIPPEFIRQQIEVVLDDIGADAIKTGMLHDAAVIETVAAVLQRACAGGPAGRRSGHGRQGRRPADRPGRDRGAEAAADRTRHGTDPEPARSRDAMRHDDRRRRGDALGRRELAGARVPGGAGQGRAPCRAIPCRTCS